MIITIYWVLPHDIWIASSVLILVHCCFSYRSYIFIVCRSLISCLFIRSLSYEEHSTQWIIRISILYSAIYKVEILSDKIVERADNVIPFYWELRNSSDFWRFEGLKRSPLRACSNIPIISTTVVGTQSHFEGGKQYNSLSLISDVAES